MVNLQTSSSDTMDGETSATLLRLFEPAVFGGGDGIGFKLYPDNRPRNLEIAMLQKGLVMTFQGEELIEEGAGFGVPIVKYNGDTFFSSTARVYLKKKGKECVSLTKVFFLDAVSRKRVSGTFVNDAFYALLHQAFERAYLKLQRLNALFDLTMRLRKVLGITTEFVRVKSKGTVEVTYQCFPGIIEVAVDLSALDKSGAQEILVLNEQGASSFRKYFDADGVVLHDGKIGAWAKVAANEAVFSNANGTVSFALENKPNALLVRGREKIKDRFSWAGMTYVLAPGTSNFNYMIRLRKAV